MSREFKMKTRDPRETGYPVYKHTKFTINPGLTVLTGCNGAGKTTLIQVIKDHLKQNDILFTHYDNHKDGGSYAQSVALADGRADVVFGLMSSSEGEGININLRDILGRVIKYTQTLNPRDLRSRDERFDFFRKEIEFKTDEVWVMLDASDSGMSIDAVINLKFVLHELERLLIEKGKVVYIIVAANEYEMCVDEQCLDVKGLRYHTYKTYKLYKRAILNSAKYKEAQIKKMEDRRNE